MEEMEEMEEIVGRMLKKNFFDIWTAESFLRMFVDATFENLKTYVLATTKDLIRMRLTVFRKSSSLLIISIDAFWKKALLKFENQNYQNRVNLLRSLEDFFEEITKPTDLNISIVLDPLMVETIKQFFNKEQEIGSISVKISNLLNEPASGLNLSDDFKKYMRQKEVLITTDWQSFSQKAKNSFLVIIGGEYLLPSQQELKERIFYLISRGKTIFLFKQIEFTDEELKNLEDIVNTSLHSDGEIVFYNGSIIVRKPFSYDTPVGSTTIILCHGQRLR